LLRRFIPFLSLACFVAFSVSPAGGAGKVAVPCGSSAYSYAGLQSDIKANGVSATLAVTEQPSVSGGHVGGWIGLGGAGEGPGGAAEWIQVGLSAFSADPSSHVYYEVTVAGSQPRYVNLASSVEPGTSYRFSVLEIPHRTSWWRVWIDKRPVSPPIYLPGSHEAWYPQAVAENWNGGAGACNTYGFRFSNVSLATGGVWRPLLRAYTFQDPGYRVVPISSTPRAFLATSL
jgi:hypothetical protein